MGGCVGVGVGTGVAVALGTPIGVGSTAGLALVAGVGVAVGAMGVGSGDGVTGGLVVAGAGGLTCARVIAPETNRHPAAVKTVSSEARRTDYVGVLGDLGLFARNGGSKQCLVAHTWK
jgi:hypothetical protein